MAIMGEIFLREIYRKEFVCVRNHTSKEYKKIRKYQGLED